MYLYYNKVLVHHRCIFGFLPDEGLRAEMLKWSTSDQLCAGFFFFHIILLYKVMITLVA